MEFICRKSIKGTLLFISLLLLTATALAAGLLTKRLKKSYSDTKAVIAKIADSESSGEAVLLWLKEAPSANWLASGSKKLQEYGYDRHTETVWDAKFRAERNQIWLILAVFCTAALSLLYLLYRLLQKQGFQKNAKLEQLLCRLQDVDPDLPDLALEPCDAALSDRIRSLQAQIQSDRKNAHAEKEATKALVTDISHQLKTPLASLRMSLELLSQEDLTPSECREFSDSCLRHLGALENLAGSLINVSRMENGLISIHAKAGDLSQTILAAVNRVYEKANEKRISIEMDTHSCPDPLLALHDAKWTAEAFINLLDNAVKYSREGSRITIRAERLTTYLKVDFIDKGPGIPKSELSKIFQRFYRGAFAERTEGSGVGLYLAREIIERQSGVLYARQRKDGTVGSVFSVHLMIPRENLQNC